MAKYESLVIGSGPAAMTAALYTTRLGHNTLIINAGGGRAAMMKDTNIVIGIPEDTSGIEFIQTGWEQLDEYGTDQVRDKVVSAEQISDEEFRVQTSNGDTYTTENIVLATGFSAETPDPPLPPTGRTGLHYCLHGNVYMFRDESVYVMGYGDGAAYLAMIMLNFTDEVDILTRGDTIEWSDKTDELLRAHPIDIIHEDIVGIEKDDDGWLKALEFEDGSIRQYRGGFAMYGLNYHTELATQLGCELNEDGTIAVDDSNQSSISGVYAVGDITSGHNEIPVALGEGAKVAIDIHYNTRDYPKSLEEFKREDT